MRILLTNDDGYRAAGINALFHALKKANHDVTIVAPELNSSGASQSIAVYSPIAITKVDQHCYYVSSTPADSVRLGLQVAFEDNNKPLDLVISGINLGENVSEDVLYSGTVGAAREATLHGIPAIACSCGGREFPHLESGAKIISDLVSRLAGNPELLKTPFLWNVNIPNVDYKDILGFEATELGKRKIHKPMEKQITPKGNVVYWQGDAGDPEDDEPISTDVAVMRRQNLVSITPLGILPTDYLQMPVVSAIAAPTKVIKKNTAS